MKRITVVLQDTTLSQIEDLKTYYRNLDDFGYPTTSEILRRSVNIAWKSRCLPFPEVEQNDS